MSMMLGPPDGIPGEVDILALEQALGFRLPEPYRTMLPRLNGAVPKQHVIRLGDQQEESIQIFGRIENISDRKKTLDTCNPFRSRSRAVRD